MQNTEYSTSVRKGRIICWSCPQNSLWSMASFFMGYTTNFLLVRFRVYHQSGKVARITMVLAFLKLNVI